MSGVKNWCGVEWCTGHPFANERHLIDMTTGRYDCCGTDALRTDSFHAAGCPNACQQPALLGGGPINQQETP